MLFRIKQLAPEPYFTAYNYLLYAVMLRLRSNDGRISLEQLSRLANALHNVPQFLVEHDGNWDDKTFRERYIEPYDREWSESSGCASLSEILDEGIRLANARDAGEEEIHPRVL